MDWNPGNSVESSSSGWADVTSAVEHCCNNKIRHDRAELVDLVKRINAGGPVFFDRENGQRTPDGWFVREIRPVEF